MFNATPYRVGKILILDISRSTSLEKQYIINYKLSENLPYHNKLAVTLRHCFVFKWMLVNLNDRRYCVGLLNMKMCVKCPRFGFCWSIYVSVGVKHFKGVLGVPKTCLDRSDLKESMEIMWFPSRCLQTQIVFLHLWW